MSAVVSLVALHLAVALFGFAGLFGKWLPLSAVAIVFGRALVAASTLWIVLRWRGRPVPVPVRGMAINGVLLALHWLTFFAAIQVSTVAIGLLGYATFPLFVLGLECLLQKRRPRAIDAVTGALAMAGLAVLVPEWSWQNNAMHGVLWGLISAFAFAWLTLRTRALRATQSSTSIGFWQNAFAAACLVPVIALQGGFGGEITPQVLLLVAALGVFCTALAHTLYIASLRRLSAHTAGVVAALEPVYGIMLAWALLAETPDLRTGIGAALLIAAAILVSWRPGTTEGNRPHISD